MNIITTLANRLGFDVRYREFDSERFAVKDLRITTVQVKPAPEKVAA